MRLSRWLVNKESVFIALVAVVLITAGAYSVEPWLGSSGLTMGYLLLILIASVYLPFIGAFVTGLLSFFALNFFFVEPRYTLNVANAEALIELLVFLTVAMTIVSLTERLKAQTERAIISQHQAESARLLAENLLKLSSQEAVLAQGSQAIASALASRVIVVAVDEVINCLFDSLADSPLPPLEASAARWVVTHQQSIGAQTGNWSSLSYWCIPLRQYDDLHAVIFVYPHSVSVFSAENLSFLQGLVDQISLAIGLLLAKQREQQAIRQAERESVQHALLASLSHDFRTPLTAILGAASSLTTQDEQLSKVQKQLLLSTIVEEVTQMTDVAENILSLTRIEALGTLALNRDWQLPEEIIGIVVRRYRRRYPNRAIQTQVQTDLPLIRVDLGLVAQAIMNLLENSTKFDKSGKTIILSAQKKDALIVFSVRDYGIGLSLADGENWKGKFVRGNQESAQPGFGLGLAICEAVAQLHQGKLCLENAIDEGLIASLCFSTSFVPENVNNESI